MSDEQPPPPSVAPPGAEQAPTLEAPEEREEIVPLDTDDTRAVHLRELMTKPWVMSLTATFGVVAFIAGTSAVGPAVGAGAAALIVLLAFLIVFVVASNRAAEDFFVHYATSRGLNRTPTGGLPPTTPLLRQGDKRYAKQIMNGTLPGGMPGALALYTYERESTDSDGNRDTDYYHFTVVLHNIPVASERIQQLFVERRSGGRWLDKAEDKFRRNQRLRLESVALDKRYEIFFGPNDDENYLKQLFSPKFIVWLTDHAPDGVAFELVAGSLCVNVKNHHDNAAELDELCQAAGTIAQRLVEEATE